MGSCLRAAVGMRVVRPRRRTICGTKTVDKETGAAVPPGAVVRSVMPGGPGAQAGLRVDDVIVAVSGETVRNPGEVVTAIDRGGVGKPLSITVQRQGQRLALVVTPVEMRALRTR